MGLNDFTLTLDDVGITDTPPTEDTSGDMTLTLDDLGLSETKAAPQTNLDAQRQAIEAGAQSSTVLDKSPTLNRLGTILKNVQSTRGVGDAATLTQLAREFEKAGIPGLTEMLTDDDFRGSVRTESEKLLASTMRSLGARFSDEIATDVNKLRAVTMAMGLLRHAPLQEGDLETVAGASIRDIVNRRIDEIKSQDPDAEVPEDFAALKDISDTEAALVYKTVFGRRRPAPRNRLERAILNWMDSANTGATNQLVFDNKAGILRSTVNSHTRALRTGLGAQFDTIVMNAVDNNRLKYQMGKLGWGVSPDGEPTRAMSENGVDFLPFVDENALTNVLTKQTDPPILRMLSQDNLLTFNSNIAAIKSAYGEETARAVQRDAIGALMLEQGRPKIRALLTKPTLGDEGEDLTDFTPFERESLNLPARVFYTVANIGEKVWTELNVARRAIEDSIGTSEGIKRLGQDAVFTYTNSIAARNETEGVADTITFLFKGLIQDPQTIGDSIASLAERGAGALTEAVVGDSLITRPEGGRFDSVWERHILKTASNEGDAETSELVGPGAFTNEKVRAALAFDAEKVKEVIDSVPVLGGQSQNERIARLSRVLRGYDTPSLQTAADVVGSIGSVLGEVVLAPARALTDDPGEALLMITGEIAGGKATEVLRTRLKNTYRNLMLPRRLRQRFMEAAVHAPAEGKLILDRVRSLIKTMTPENHPRRMRALRELEAVLEDSIDTGRRVSHKRLKQSAKTFADEVSNLDIAEPEVIEAAVASETGVFRDLRDAVNTTVGRVNKPGRFWEITLGEKVLDDFEARIDRTLRGSPEVQRQFEANLEEFIANNKRRPEGLELLDLLPDNGEYSFAHFLAAREKYGRSTPFAVIRSTLGRVGGKVLNRLLSVAPERLERMLTAGETALNRAAHAAADRMSAEYDFRIYRARMRRVLNVPRRTLNNTVDELDTLRRGLEALIEVEPSDSHKAALRAELNGVTDDLAEVTIQRNRIDTFIDRLEQHDPTQPFNPGADFLDVQQLLTPEAWQALIDTNPELFGELAGQRVVKTQRAKPLSPDKIEGMQEARKLLRNEIRDTIRELRTFRSDRLAADSVGRELEAEVERLERLQGVVERATNDPNVRVDFEKLRAAAPPTVQRALDLLKNSGLIDANTSEGEVFGFLRDLDSLLRTRDPDVVGLATTPRMLAFLIDGDSARTLARLYENSGSSLSYQQWVEAQLRGGAGVSRAARKILRPAQRRLERLMQAIDKRAPVFTGEPTVVGSGTSVFERFIRNIDTARARQLSETIDGIRARLAQRRKDLLDNKISSREELETTERLAQLRRQDGELASRIMEGQNPPEVVVGLDPKKTGLLSEMLFHRGVDEPGLQRALQDVGVTVRGARNLGFRGNPFNASSMPFYLKAMSQRLLRNSLINRLAMAEMRVGDLANQLARLSEGERALLGRAQRVGVLPSQLLDSNPNLRRLINEPTTPTMMLDELYAREAQQFADTLEAFRDSGFIDNAAYGALVKDGYSPRLFGAFERNKAVVGATRVRTAATTDEVPAQFGGLRSKDPFRLKRDINEFRVRIAEPNRIVDKLFKTFDEAKTFVSHFYGANVDGLDAQGVATGRTAFGDNFTIVAPLGKQRLKILDFLDSDRFNPVARLKRLSQMHRDYFLHSYVEALNLYGGLVLSPEQFKGLATDLLRRPGKAAAKFENEFLLMPDNRGFFGSLAGKYVHKDVIRAMNDAAENHTVLQSWVEGVQEAFEAAGRGGDLASFSAELAGNPAVRAVKGVVKVTNAIAKTTQILLSPGVWVANWTFNVLLDRASGTRVTDIDNLDLLHRAMNETFPGRVSRGPEFFQAVEDGVIGGTIFDRGNSAVLKLLQTEIGLRGKSFKELMDLRERRKEVFDKVAAAEAEGTVSAETVAALRNELSALDGVIEERRAGWLKGLARGTLRFLTGARSVLGDNPADFLRGLYNHIDDSWKYAAYLALRRAGASREAAKAHIADFWQNYDNVPNTLNNLGPLTSMVTAFPYELGRLGFNYLTKRPAQFMGTMMMLPAINLAAMSAAGVNPDRVLAAIQQTGSQSDVEASLKLMSGLYFFNKKGELAWQVDFSNMIPFAEMITQRGIFGSAVDNLLPPEKNRDATSVAIRAITGIPSSLIGNNPLLNTVASFVFNRDPLTKRRIYDENMPALRKLAALGKSITKTYLPPLTPYFGRAGERFDKILNAGIDPRSRRLRGTIDNSPLTPLIKAVTGVTVRARDLPFNRIPDRAVADEQDIVRGGILRAMYELGVDPGRDTALNSVYNDLVKLYTRAKDETLDPAARDRALAEFNDLIQTRAKARFGGVEFEEVKTAKEMDNFIRRFDEFDTLDRWRNLPIHLQSVLLAAFDKQGVGAPRLNELMANAMMTEQLSQRSVGDPERVQQAVDILDDYLDSTPAASARLARYRDWIRDVLLPQSQAKRIAERFQTETKEALKGLRNEVRTRVIGTSLGNPEIDRLIKDAQ